MTTKVYSPSSVKRKRRTKAELESLKESILDISEENNSMTLRQLYYQMVSRSLIEKTEKEYNNIGRLVTVMRRSRELPFHAIADNTRWMRKQTTHNSLEGFLEEQQTFYRRDLWQDQGVYVEIWLEKDALAGVLSDVTYEWDVPLMVTRGYASLSYLWSAAETIKAVGKPALLYYFGDCDPSGRDIPRAVKASLQQLAPDADITFEVVAVTDQQVEDLELPMRPTKSTDSRSANFEGRSVELDAIPPRELRRLCGELITQHIEEVSLARHTRIEREERQTLADISWRLINGHAHPE